jgi:hypothetical protein
MVINLDDKGMEKWGIILKTGIWKGEILSNKNTPVLS